MGKILDDENKEVIKGVSEEKFEKTQNPYVPNEDVTAAQNTNKNALSNLESLTSKDKIISDDVTDAINSSFKTPSSVTKADKYLSSQLQKIQSGKTSYSDQVKDMMDKIMNRDKFSYDVDNDPLFQQALASAMNSGKTAMQDTIGQASALTGGYGSSYATTAGNQAYNAFIEDAYDNLPQYYQMALEAYQMEGDEMYRQYGMLSAEDDKEFNRNVTAYDATYQHRNQMYNEAYTQYRDNKSDAFAMANLQLSEHGQRVSDAYNYYNATSDYADTLYERDYNSWADSINMAWKEIEALTNDAWKQTEFDNNNYWKEKDFAQTEDHFTRNQEFQSSESQKDRDWRTREAEKERAFTASENAKNRSVKPGTVGSTINVPSEIEKEAKNAKNDEARRKYVASMVEKGYITQDQGAYLLDNYNQGALKDRVWAVEDKGGWNWGGGMDNNAKVKDQFDNVYKISELYDEAKKTMGEDEAEKWIISLQKELGISKLD